MTDRKDENVAVNKARQADLSQRPLDRPPPLGRPGKDPGPATDEARKIDAAKPESEKDAAGSDVHRDNVNPNAYSAESARKPRDSVSTPSINEPKPGEQVAFKVPEDHTATTPETLEQAYPDGYRGHEGVADLGGTERQAEKVKVTARPPVVGKVSDAADDPDDLEDEIDQAKKDGDFKSMHRSRPSWPKKR